MGLPASGSTLSTFTASDGDNIAVQDWPLSEGLSLRGVVVLVHGLGEHAGRYDPLAQQLNAWGFAVRGYDQYGHGQSGGVRGGLPVDGRLVDDLAEIVDSTRLRTPRDVPLLLLGHSVGGLVAASYVAACPRNVDGLVLSSPALATRLGPVQRLLLGTLPLVAPQVRVGNGLDPHWLSHDPEVVRAYRDDPLVHDRISARLARFIADQGQRVVAQAARWTVPTLLLYAGDDRLVDPAGSHAFSEAASDSVVTSCCYPAMYHEIFHEPDAQKAYDALARWLDERY
ncbi:MAG: alpha/beta hydrolase [Comamonadaceae bacterium]|nr:MAG: alpha/beta hydrolase [Comamonadaceae bacterium]